MAILLLESFDDGLWGSRVVGLVSGNVGASYGLHGDGASEGLAESYLLHEHVWDQNPNTSTAWTYTTINAMELGQEVRDS